MKKLFASLDESKEAHQSGAHWTKSALMVTNYTPKQFEAQVKKLFALLDQSKDAHQSSINWTKSVPI